LGPGEPGIELHLNRHHDATHITFEPAVGITRFWEIGGYLQFAQGKYEGVKLRTKFVTPEGALGDFRLGINFEVALEPGGNVGGEMLGELRRRLASSRAAEIRTAAEEQSKILRLRIGKFLREGAVQ